MKYEFHKFDDPNHMSEVIRCSLCGCVEKRIDYDEKLCDNPDSVKDELKEMLNEKILEFLFPDEKVRKVVEATEVFVGLANGIINAAQKNGRSEEETKKALGLLALNLLGKTGVE